MTRRLRRAALIGTGVAALCAAVAAAALGVDGLTRQDGAFVGTRWCTGGFLTEGQTIWVGIEWTPGNGSGFIRRQPSRGTVPGIRFAGFGVATGADTFVGVPTWFAAVAGVGTAVWARRRLARPSREPARGFAIEPVADRGEGSG